MNTSVRRALFVASVERYVGFIANFVVLVIVSRLLTPGEIGLAVLGTAAISVLESVRDFGASSYLVQQREITRANVRTAFTVMFGITTLLSIGMLASAQLVASYYNNDKLIPYLELIAVSFMASPFSGTIMALMRRDMEFGRLAFVGIASQLIGSILIIVLAVLGFSYMSFAWGAFATSVSGALLAILARPSFWIFRPLLSDWRSVLAFGGISSATAIINRLYDVLPLLVMGRVLPVDNMALYSRAQNLCQLADKLIFTGIGTVALPALAREAREGRSLKDAYLGGLGYITAVYWPILTLLALLAHPVVLVVLGHQWLDIVPIVQVMAIAMLVFFPAILSYPTLVAAGGISDTLRASLISLPPSACIMATAASHGPFAVAASQLLTMPLQVLVVLWFIRKRVYFGWFDLLVAVQKSAFVTIGSLILPVMVVLASGNGLQVGFPAAVLAAVSACVGWLVAVAATKHQLRGELIWAAEFLSSWLWKRRTV